MIYFIYLPSYLLLFYSLYLFKKDIEKNIIEIGFLIGILYFIFIPLTAYLLNNGYESYDILANKSWSNHTDTFNNLKVNILLSIILTLNILLLYSFKFFKNKNLKKNKNKKYILVTKYKLIFIFILSIFPILFLELMIPSSITHWYLKAKYMNEHFGMVAVISKYLYTSMRFVLLIILLNNFKVSQKYHYLIMLVVLAIIDMYITGNRIFLVIVIFSILIEFIILKKTILIFYLTLIFIPLGGFLIAWSQIRSLLGHMSLIESIEISYKVFEKINFTDIVFQLTEGADFLILLSIIRDFGTRIDYIVGESFLKLFVFFIPRTIYEDKPDAIARVMGAYYQPETPGLALNTTLLGEEFANFGLLGAFIILFLLLGFHLMRKVSNRYIRYYMTPFYFMFPFLITRTNTSDILIQVIIAFLVLLILTKRSK